MQTWRRRAWLALANLFFALRPAIVADWLKSLLRVPRVTLDTAHGRFAIDPLSYLGRALLQHGLYEPEMIRCLSQLLRRGDVLVDLGANEGYFSVVGARLVEPAGRVLAIEPQARLQSVLRQNCELNALRNVAVVQCAVGDHDGLAQLHLAPSLNSGSSALSQPTRYRLQTEQVPLHTLAAVLKQHELQRVRLLKIDIEGFEYEAILGSRQLFESRAIEHIALELHPLQLRSRKLSPDAIERFLEDCGYRRNPAFGNLLYSAA